MAVWHIQENINLFDPGGGGGDLQDAYDNSPAGQARILVNAPQGRVEFRDAPTTIGDIFVVSDSAGASLFRVDGSTGNIVMVNNVLAQNLQNGSGDPNGVVFGNKGDIFQRTDGATGDETLYVSLGGLSWAALATSSGTTFVKELIPAVNTGSLDTNFFLSFTPASNSLDLELNGLGLIEGAGLEYTVSGTTIDYLAGSGTATPMESTDFFEAQYAL